MFFRCTMDGRMVSQEKAIILKGQPLNLAFKFSSHIYQFLRQKFLYYSRALKIRKYRLQYVLQGTVNSIKQQTFIVYLTMCISFREFKKYKVWSLHLRVKTKSGSKTSICKISGQQLSAKPCDTVQKFENSSEKKELSVGCKCLFEKDSQSRRHLKLILNRQNNIDFEEKFI